MTEEQERMLYQVHAAVCNGLKEDVSTIKAWIEDYPNKCYFLQWQKKKQEIQRNKIPLWQLIVASIIGLPTMVGGIYGLITWVW
jgi:hypothetical protein